MLDDQRAEETFAGSGNPCHPENRIAALIFNPWLSLRVSEDPIAGLWLTHVRDAVKVLLLPHIQGLADVHGKYGK